MPEYRFSWFKCASCAERTHCEHCAEEVSEELRKVPGVESVRVNGAAKTLSVDGKGLDADDIEERLEDFGIFVS